MTDGTMTTARCILVDGGVLYLALGGEASDPARFQQPGDAEWLTLPDIELGNRNPWRIVDLAAAALGLPGVRSVEVRASEDEEHGR